MSAEDGLEFWIDPGDASAEDIAEFLIALSALHEAYGGGPLTFDLDGMMMPSSEDE
jgi:hypothetical protein